MSEQLVVDSGAFAASHEVLEGSLAVGGMARLRADLAGDEGVLAYRIEGGSNARRQPVIRYRVTGTLTLTCQRCLTPMTYPVDVSAGVQLVKDAASLPEIADEDPTLDCVVEDHRFDLRSLIEDEVILALPIAPTHAAGQCPARAGGDNASARPNPFEALRALKGNTSE